MSSLRNGGVQSKGLAVVPGGGNGTPAKQDLPPAFDGTIASACELGIRLEDFIKMTRLARETEPGVARFLDAWDTLGASERQARGAADAICEQVGLASVDLLRVAADAACRFSMCVVQMQVALVLPSIVLRSVETALTDKGIADRKMLFQHSGFLPTPKTSQTAFSAMQNAQATAAAQPVSLPPVEQTIRVLSAKFNTMRGLPRPPAAKGTEPSPGEAPEEPEDDGK